MIPEVLKSFSCVYCFHHGPFPLTRQCYWDIYRPDLLLDVRNIHYKIINPYTRGEWWYWICFKIQNNSLAFPTCVICRPQQSRSLEQRNAYNLQDQFKFLNCKVKLWGSKNIIHDGVKCENKAVNKNKVKLRIQYYYLGNPDKCASNISLKALIK